MCKISPKNDQPDILKKRNSTLRCNIHMLHGHKSRTFQRNNAKQIRGADGGRGSYKGWGGRIISRCGTDGVSTSSQPYT